MGLPFSRLDDGRIYQRPFGGQSKKLRRRAGGTYCGGSRPYRSRTVAQLYQQNLKTTPPFSPEWYALDLVKTRMAQWSVVPHCALNW